MFRSFLADRRGNYALMTAISMVPIMGGLAIGVDYAQLTRLKEEASNALDAANIGTARRYIEGVSEGTLQSYAEDFFFANAGDLGRSDAKLNLVLPNNTTGGGTMKLSAIITYKPSFLPAFTAMLGKNAVNSISFNVASEVRLKNTLEVALVLDNSGSMSEKGGSSGKVRMDLLKDAAKQLVDTLAAQSLQMKQVAKPVQFSLVPFAASVNVGPQYATATWMDQDGISPIHHENFDWTTMGAADANKRVEKSGNIFYKKGTGWGAEENQKVTRFTMYNDVKRITGYTLVKTGTEWVCTSSWRGTCLVGYWRDITVNQPNYGPYAAWKGCVEERPYPYNINDTAPAAATPATLYVPMYGPDESSQVASYNSWLPDVTSSSNDATRQKYMPKYFAPTDNAGETIRSADNVIVGPNQSCTTTPITPLTDVSVDAGKTSIKSAIDAMQPLGATNVPDGMMWGWRTVSSGAPFTEGRPETEKGNDKVVIVVTDGANTYYTPSSLGYSDSGGNKSIYSSLGYTKLINSTEDGRIFRGVGTSISKTTFTNANYTSAMNDHFQQLCANAKANNIMVMTVAVDLDATNTAEKTQIDLMKSCASDSRYRMGADGKPAKLFWNSTGASLANDFKEIGNELSNLRIVS